MFLLKKNVKDFSPLYVLHLKNLFKWWQRQLSLKLQIQFHFRYDSLKFNKHRKQPAKHQHLGIISLMCSFLRQDSIKPYFQPREILLFFKLIFSVLEHSLKFQPGSFHNSSFLFPQFLV